MTRFRQIVAYVLPIALPYLVSYLQGLLAHPPGWMAAGAGVAGLASVAASLRIHPNGIKGPPVPRLAVVFLALALAGPARAQSALTYPISADLTLHPDVSFIAVQYDATHKAWIGAAPVALQIVVTSKRLGDAGAGVGGTLTVGSDQRPVGGGTAALFSPAINLGPTVWRFAFSATRTFGPGAAWLLGVAPSLQL